jgi:hypothetical protein
MSKIMPAIAGFQGASNYTNDPSWAPTPEYPTDWWNPRVTPDVAQAQNAIALLARYCAAPLSGGNAIGTLGTFPLALGSNRGTWSLVSSTRLTFGEAGTYVIRFSFAGKSADTTNPKAFDVALLKNGATTLGKTTAVRFSATTTIELVTPVVEIVTALSASDYLELQNTSGDILTSSSTYNAGIVARRIG